MPTVDIHDLKQSVLEPKQRQLESLEESFAAEFHFAARDEVGVWRPIAVEFFREDSEQELLPDQAKACQQASETKLPQVFARPGGESVLAMPLPGGHPTFRVAIALITSDDPTTLLRMAQLWQRAAEDKERADRFQVENDHFAQQLTEGLEELTFLRSMVENLDVSESSNDLLALAESTLPLLNETVKSECLTLLMVNDESDPLDAAPVMCVGPKPVHDSLSTRLVEWFGSAALQQPVVKNRLAGAPEGAKMRGVREFMLVPIASRHRQMGWLLAINRHWPGRERTESEWPLSQLEFGTSEASLLSTTASLLATHASNLDLFREKQQLLIGVVRSLVSAVEAKDKYTCGHSERVALFARVLAEQSGYSKAACEKLYLTGLLHDVGKIGVSDAVLKKEGKLTEEEFAEIKRHPGEGWAILQDLEQLGYVLPGVLHHHEHMDGTGYPDGLAGQEIPIDGRLLAIVDAYDAMTSDRPYRQGMPAERAQKILRAGAGTQWDAKLIDAFFEVIHQIERIRRHYKHRERPVRKCLVADSQTEGV